MVPPGYVIGQVAAPRVEEPEEPLYVNAKQYHRILKRRAARANLEAQNRLMQRGRKFMHESRHLHAMRRPRGPGGRFLTAAEIAALEEKGEHNNDNKTAGRSKDSAISSSSNNNNDNLDISSNINNHSNDSSSGSSNNNSNGYYSSTTRTAPPSQPDHGFRAT
ncbi:Transcriptional activator [Modicella reniformis]|uniref:Transcriptional activator HAP2 n=1 Tax=Modicella reniformis TaxID=1440133 RepID=A0A9P6MDB7_9FUNG|nr:Transcriptional activator [Modicella reniformis]